MHTFFPISENKRSERKTLVNILKMLCNTTVMKNPRFILFLSVNILAMMGTYVFGSFFPQYMVFRGYSMTEASAAISFNGISSSIGRIVAGYLCCRFYSYRPLLFVIFLGGCGASFFAVTIAESYVTFVVTSVIYGVTSGKLNLAIENFVVIVD